MTEQKETTKPTKPLTLSTTARSGAAAAKGSETQVRQKFSHGRTRVVADFAMKGRPLAPDFTHVTQCQPFRARRLSITTIR